MNAALWYLIRTSGRNRLSRQLRRLRTPRYALAFGLGLLYLWFFLLRSGRSQAPLNDASSSVIIAMVSILVLAYLAWSWTFGTDRSALAFTRAEVALLFPAPISRRGLILYKLARSQIGILISVIVWSLILNRGGDAIGSLMRGAGLWMGITTLSLHRLGIGLWRAGLTEHGGGAARRSIPVLAVFMAALGLVAWTFWDARLLITDASGLRAQVLAVMAVLETAPGAWVFYPIRLAFSPFLAREFVPWLAAMGQAGLLLLLHLWWVVGSDAAFEEAAAEASEKQAQRIAEMRARRGGGAVVKRTATRRTIPLAPTGRAAVAIVWKNALWVVRTDQLRGLLIPPLLFVAAAAYFGPRSESGAIIVAVLGLAWMGLLFLFGPMSMRNDLRSDLLHLPMLKTLPISGRDVVLSQVLSGALVMWVPQLMVLVAVVVALAFAPGASPVPVQAVGAGLLGAPLLLLGLNAANFSLHNGLALLLPGWVKLGERGPSGVEATGQMMLTSVVTLLGLALLLIVPALAAGLGYLAAGSMLATRVLLATTAAALVLGLETWSIVMALGGSFERVEPTQVT